MTDDWEKLGQEVRERRLELGYTQTDVQAAGGPSTALLRGIENATSKTLSRSKRRELEQVLRWPRGHIDAILAGHPMQGSLLDVGAPEPPKLRPVGTFSGAHSWTGSFTGETTPERSDSGLVLDALSALERATAAVRNGNPNAALGAIDGAQSALVRLLPRIFAADEGRTSERDVPSQNAYSDERDELRAVANEDDTLEQISEDQQQEP